MLNKLLITSRTHKQRKKILKKVHTKGQAGWVEQEVGSRKESYLNINIKKG